MGNNSEQYIAVYEKQVKLEFSNFVNFVNSVNKEGSHYSGERFNDQQNNYENGCSRGQVALMTVPLPFVDSIEKIPPESSVLSRMLSSPNPLVVGPRREHASSRSKPWPLSWTTKCIASFIFVSLRTTDAVLLCLATLFRASCNTL